MRHNSRDWQRRENRYWVAELTSIMLHCTVCKIAWDRLWASHSLWNTRWNCTDPPQFWHLPTFSNCSNVIHFFASISTSCIVDTDSAGPASASSMWAGNPTFTFVTKANPEVLKEWKIWNCRIIYPRTISLLEEQIAMPATGKMKQINSLLCSQSMKKCNFILLQGTGEREPSSSDLLLQRCERAHLSPAFISMVTTQSIQPTDFILLTVCPAESRHVLISFHNCVCMDITNARWLHNS